MSEKVKLRVWGDFASFNRPEMKVERVSYDVMTPSAARGLLEAIYWKPQIQWVVERIHVLKPIRFTQIRRNEIKDKIAAGSVSKAMKGGTGRLGIDVGNSKNRQQRAALLLRDVAYGIEARIKVLDASDESGQTSFNPWRKHFEMFRRRAAKGQYFHHPYLGNREFPADFELVESFPHPPAELQKETDLGFMLHDIVYREAKDGKVIESNTGRRLNAEPRFFRAILKQGVMDIPTQDETWG